MINPAREAALGALIDFRARGAWPDRKLNSALRGLSAEDAALATAIVYGVLQQRELLDFYIAQYSSVKIRRMMPQVLDALRVGAYQLVFLDKVPAYAAINESVALAKAHGGARAGGFVNAVLRTLERERDRLPEPDKTDIIQYLSIKYSHPAPLVERFAALLGADGAQALLNANNANAPHTARVNTLKTAAEQVIGELPPGAAAEHEYLPDALTIRSPREAASLLDEGKLYLMDAASQLCVTALAPRAGAQVLDLCAAPGGKAMLAAQIMGNEGRILARDVHTGKVERLARTAVLYGCDIIECKAADAAVYDAALARSADFVICDVPCSGYGIIRKKPDIRYKSLESAAELPDLQLKIALNAAKYLREGGAMVYSTCTLLPEENERVVEKLLASESGLALEAFELPKFGRIDGGMLTLWPHLHGTDGFFIAKLRKTK